MNYAAPESPVGPVAELNPRLVLVETGPLPLRGGAGIPVHRRARGADEGREQVGGAPQREAAQQRLRHGPRQEREEVSREDGRAEGRLQEAPEDAGRRGGEEKEEGQQEDGESEELELGPSHGAAVSS